MAQSLGSFGTPRGAVDLDFDYFGETIRVHPHATDLGLVDFMAAAAGINMEDQGAVVAAMGHIVGWLQQQIHPDDWDRFYATAKANGQTVNDLMVVAQGLTEAVAGFPTGQPSGSRSERRQKKPAKKSRAVSSSPGGGPHHGTVTSAGPDGSARAALTLLQGRPDLQQAVISRHQAMSAQAG